MNEILHRSASGDKDDDKQLKSTHKIRYSITGKAAHGRLRPLLPSHWIDCSPFAPSFNGYDSIGGHGENKLHFIWENAPRSETKPFRNDASCYSHLPNGIDILDDKWVLGRIFSSTSEAADDRHFAPLETHCFRGRSGLETFINQTRKKDLVTVNTNCYLKDLDVKYNSIEKQIKVLEPKNLWVIKDAMSNGFGGIWILNANNSSSVLLNPERSPLQENHRYVAQKYSWPPVLYRGRKCHIRVYAVMMNGRAYVHNRCFLHVANEKFECEMNGGDDQEHFEAAVHITNCCANSHCSQKFAGEILADFDLKEARAEESVVPLNEYFPSVAASVKKLAEKTSMYVQGGEKNRGFEYLGLDFILSEKSVSSAAGGVRTLPIAYLLEVNCPPSQDTATGLEHAERLHDEVLSDLLKMWVIPNVLNGIDSMYSPEETFGWKCVYLEAKSSTSEFKDEDVIKPSNAAILNKIRWGMFERRLAKAASVKKENEGAGDTLLSSSVQRIIGFARSQFPYFNNDKGPINIQSRIFLENAGGSQVPRQVINSMVASLSQRNRSVIGHKSKEKARSVSITLLGGSHERHTAFFGSNASSLFERLAHRYVDSGFLSKGDEIILASESHVANVDPWLNAAQEIGAEVMWWTQTSETSALHPSSGKSFRSTNFSRLLSNKTRIVCLSHSSNVLGSVRDIKALCTEVRQKCPKAHIVVDGVAVAAHLYPHVDKLGVDWYCVSCHKMFGPHVGIIIGRNDAVKYLEKELSPHKKEDVYRMLEIGTINYEACNGIIGLGGYIGALASFDWNHKNSDKVSHRPGENPVQTSASPLVSRRLCEDDVLEAFQRINMVEKVLLDDVIGKLRICKNVQILSDTPDLPIISFFHSKISSKAIVEWCSKNCIDIRCGSFLTTGILQTELNFVDQCKESFGGIVRISFSHYNNSDDAKRVIATLQSMPGWDE
jgi:selenocysteine lyase/cysteine desulfurase